MKEIVISNFKRSPFTPAKKGALARVRPDDLAAQVIKGMLLDTSFDSALIEDIIMGCAFPEAEQGFNVAKIIGFLAGLPNNVAGATVNRFCGSSMQSVHMAAGAIAMGAGDCFICAGIESMTRVPMGGYNPMPNPVLLKGAPGNDLDVYISMGLTAENVANQYGLSRVAQEEFAVVSHDKAAKAAANGHFDDEIVPITTKDGQIVDKDGCIRPGTTVDALSGLKPAFDASGSVTAGTSSPLTDGAAAVIVSSADFAAKHGLDVLAKIKSVAVDGCHPETMGLGPVGATKKALDRAGLTMDEIDIVEINEAFASQSMACLKDLGIDASKVNLDGGAIALGHPLGATGARITGKVASLIKREGKRYGLATQCIGGGQGIATIVESV